MWSLSEFILKLNQAGCNAEETAFEPILKALNVYNTFFFIHPKAKQNKIVNAIINACSDFLGNIPQEDKTFYDEGAFRKAYPGALEVLALQKQAVSMRYFPEINFTPSAKLPFNEARKQFIHQSRWQLLRDKVLGKGKMLDPIFWQEKRFSGLEGVEFWLNQSISRLTENKIVSFREVVSSESRVVYIDNPASLMVHFRDGKLHASKNGKLLALDSSLAPKNQNNRSGYYLYVLDQAGNLYVNSFEQEMSHVKFHHSSFLKGARVACAGLMKVEKGLLKDVTVESGHYKPNKKHLLKLLSVLKEKGVDLSNVTVNDTMGGSFKMANEFLRKRGVCLPIDVAEYFYGLAMWQFEKNREVMGAKKQIKENLVTAISLGHSRAIFDLAKMLSSGNLIEHPHEIDLSDQTTYAATIDDMEESRVTNKIESLRYFEMLLIHQEPIKIETAKFLTSNIRTFPLEFQQKVLNLAFRLSCLTMQDEKENNVIKGQNVIPKQTLDIAANTSTSELLKLLNTKLFAHGTHHMSCSDHAQNVLTWSCHSQREHPLPQAMQPQAHTQAAKQGGYSTLSALLP